MCFIRCSWEPLVGSNIKKYVTPQSSGWSKIFFRINEISVRIKGFPRGSKFISLRDTSLWSPDQNMFFSKILVDRWNTLRIENSDGSKSFLSSGWAPQWNSVDDWGRMQVYILSYTQQIYFWITMKFLRCASIHQFLIRFVVATIRPIVQVGCYIQLVYNF